MFFNAVVSVVQMWFPNVVMGPYVDNDIERLLVFDSFYHFNATRDYLYLQNGKNIGAIHLNRFKLQCDMLSKKCARWETVLAYSTRLQV